MQRKIKIKSIIFKNNEFEIKQINDQENGIKFYLQEEFNDYFPGNIYSNNTYSLEKLNIRTLDNEVWTLFNCHFTYRVAPDYYYYIHLIYSEIVKNNVNNRDFDCNRLVVKLKWYKTTEFDFFCDKLFFNYDNYKISVMKFKNYIKVEIKSQDYAKASALYKHFTYIFELLNIIYGYFLKRDIVVYYNDTKKIIVENNIVDKYISSRKYIKKDLYFLNSIDINEFENIYSKYIDLRKKAQLQFDLYFISTMESNQYTELNVVSILQIYDGIFDKLSQFKDKLICYPEELNRQIVDCINQVDFSDLCDKYKVDIDINKRIIDRIESMYYSSYDKKLRTIFKINNKLIFYKEIHKEKKHLSFNNLIEKCKNSRNKISHADDKDIYLKELENTVYLYKFVLTFRMLIFNEVSLYKYVDNIKLSRHINNLDLYIESKLNIN